MADKVERTREQEIADGLERGELLSTLKCGCVIIQDRTADAYIVYCPLHETAAKTCISINPSNPMAVAEKIPNLIRSAKPLIDELESYGSDKPYAFDRFKSDCAAITKPAKKGD